MSGGRVSIAVRRRVMSAQSQALWLLSETCLSAMPVMRTSANSQVPTRRSISTLALSACRASWSKWACVESPTSTSTDGKS